jgi:hypothetical protein
MTAVKFRRIGLFGGPLLGLLCYHLLPLHYSTGSGQLIEFTQAGRATLGLMIWMATWWVTEAVDIEVTALLPIAIFPLFGIAPLSKVQPLRGGRDFSLHGRLHGGHRAIAEVAMRVNERPANERSPRTGAQEKNPALASVPTIPPPRLCVHDVKEKHEKENPENPRVCRLRRLIEREHRAGG